MTTTIEEESMATTTLTPERAREQLDALTAADREHPTDEPDHGERRQLSFDVGGASPDFASLKLTGDLGTGRELEKGEEVSIRIATTDGEVIAEGAGYVVSVAFKDKRNKFGDIESTERAHTVAIA